MYLTSPDVLWIDVTLDKTIIEKTVVANTIVIVFVFAFCLTIPLNLVFPEPMLRPFVKIPIQKLLGATVGPTKWNVKRIFQKKKI